MNNKEKTKAALQTETNDGISRRTAIRKMGYAAFASSTMFLLLNNPTKVHAQSPNDPGDPGGGWNWGDKDDGNNRNSGGRDYGSYDWD